MRTFSDEECRHHENDGCRKERAFVVTNIEKPAGDETRKEGERILYQKIRICNADLRGASNLQRAYPCTEG